ncbi:acyltransferase family protein [Lentzea albidocapillata]|uniref:Peptidoglycan/LPS O-acetylase OafA/YrhL, contains acyltransferase and SGNH-hydrolase domains n=1 Tax=Lentzea albidocapillata TaxID=40571 RepID=A0A1W2FG55_9PSEU|nr:acyltransferase [Lentzea albidocapillata]SMD20901.1 Peptidoglycan/LPS O-acetylase OafA/YrhL, contains acyltransferase and SGNH-hydrolase domains [Lentzea albidocapillata]
MTHEQFLALKRFPALDGVRAIAALMVVFFHYGGPQWLQGWLGVQIFFVLSGFLITTLLLREQARTGRISLRDFYRRRAFRILPVYLVVLLVTAAGLLVAGQFWQNPLGRDFPLYLTFLNEFGHGGAYGHSWSLGVEQKFYLVWPLLAFALLPRRRPAVTVGLMALALAVVPFTVSSDPKGWSVHYFTVLVGCALALLMNNRRGFALVRPFTTPWVILLFLGVHLSVPLISGALDGVIPGFVSVVPIYAVAVGLALPSLLTPGRVQRLLSARPMAWLGERSYSIYLVQSIAHSVVLLTGASGLVMALLTSLVAIGIADLTYRFVELPMIERGRSHRRAGNAPAPIGQ